MIKLKNKKFLAYTMILALIASFTCSGAVSAQENAPGIVYVAPNGNDNAPGTIDQPLKSVEKAVKIVKPNGTVHIKEGTYKVNQSTIYKSITIIGENKEKTILQSIQTKYNNGIFDFRGGYAEVKNLTIKKTNAPAIQCTNTNLKVENCDFSDSKSSVGAFIAFTSSYVKDPSGKDNLVVENCNFKNGISDATMSVWGGLSCGGAIDSSGGSARIVGCNFTDNKALQKTVNNFTFGGAISVRGNSVSVENCIFKNNEAIGKNSKGGAIYTSCDAVSIDGCTFESNTAGLGGAIYKDKPTSFNVKNSVFKKNNAKLEGGAIWADNFISQDNVIFEDNKANKKLNSVFVYYH